MRTWPTVLVLVTLGASCAPGLVHASGSKPLSLQLYTPSYQLLGDTFPFNESITPGNVRFDTTTALIKSALNRANPNGGEGVIPGDTLVYTAAWAGDDTRVDLVFRVWPGPGNYSGRYHGAPPFNANWLRHTPLWRVPSDTTQGTAVAGDGSWWGQYMGASGEVGSKPSGHTASYWDPQTWNSARMDSAELEYFPLESRGIGYPSPDQWMGTYHESDPKFATLGIARTYCFLVNPAGPADNTNVCCDAASCAGFAESWPPSSYAGATTTTTEGTKILPDGLFTPGTEIQYIVRRSAASVPGVPLAMSPDTTVVSYQPGMGGSVDFERYDHVDVLPDMWKDERWGGTGLACILYVDAADGHGVEPTMLGALDSTAGFGYDNGAGRGWRCTNASWNNVDSPAGFVPENLGQHGLAYDKFDLRGAESRGSDRLGCRYTGDAALIPPVLVAKQCKQGPSLAILDFHYNVIIWDSGDLDSTASAMHCGSVGNGKQSNDAGLIRQWLASAGVSNRKALWAAGDGLAQDLATAGTASAAGLLADMGVTYINDSYWDLSGNTVAGAVFKPLDADPGLSDPFHSARRYGFLNTGTDRLDVIDANGAVANVLRAARYEDQSDRGNGGAGPWGASVYRRYNNASSQYFATLFDGFSLQHLRAWNGLGDPTTTAIPLTYNDHGRGAWLEDAQVVFNLCAPRGFDDASGVPTANLTLGPVPNPSLAGTASVRFSLAQPAKVTIRFYDVAGRLVHEAQLNGVAGANNYRWNGVTVTGARATAGVYFYRVSAPGIDFGRQAQRMVILGSAGP